MYERMVVETLYDEATYDVWVCVEHKTLVSIKEM